MDLFSYKKNLQNRGNNMSQVRRKQSDEIINATFKSDPAYKRVYILTKDGWKFEDAKYQLHSTPSILKDAVDYYLQFRPQVRYPIGSYVFVPDDMELELNFTGIELDNPFSLSDDEIIQYCWFIVGRDDSLAYVRHNILKCNWNFRWIYDGKINSCWGANRSANSYTSCNTYPIKYYTARCIRKRCSACSLIAGTSLEPYKLQHSDEKSANVKSSKIIRIGKSAAKLRIGEGSTTIGRNTIRSKRSEKRTA